MRCPNTTREHTVILRCTRVADHPGPCALDFYDAADTELSPVESRACERYDCSGPVGGYVLVLLVVAAFTLVLGVAHLQEHFVAEAVHSIREILRLVGGG